MPPNIQSLLATLNPSQKQALLEIVQDINQSQKKGNRLERVLYGEVGSGKTRVAMAAAAYVTKILKGQTALMCPTTALARQHVRSYNRTKGRDPDDLQHGDLALVVSKQTTAEREEHRNRRAQERKSGLVIGTHALANCKFGNLRLVIIDEQQKFGNEICNQLREKLVPRDGGAVLLLTATPIPRTVAQIVCEGWGDDVLEHDKTKRGVKVSAIESRQKEKKRVTTTVLSDARSKATKSKILKAVAKHSCANPGISILVAAAIEKSKDKSLIDCQEVTEMLNSTEGKKLGITKRKIGIIHGKMKRKERDAVIEHAMKGVKTILVATSIVEVGLHIPTANLVVILQCDRFGLSQIHQMRGRVGRSRNSLPTAECILVTPAKDEIKDKCKRRTEAASRNNGGTEGMDLAVEDAIIRGPGDLTTGTTQHGYSE